MKQPTWSVIQADCLAAMRDMEADSVDAIVTDPPAGINFMNAAFDSDRGGRNQWIAWLAEIMEEAYRVMKPGAHGFVWALPRTSHWTAMALEDAGFEIRDRIAHHQGAGFPKSASISKHIDKMAGAERDVLAANPHARPNSDGKPWLGGVKGKEQSHPPLTAPATDAAKQWSGWGTALKPAVEDYWHVVKPESIAWHCSIMIQTLGGLESELCKLVAKSAGESSRPTPRHSNEAKGASVPTDVPISTEAAPENETETGRAEDTDSGADTSASTSAAVSIALSMLSSWKSILEDALSLTSRFTTETESSLITDLKTLNSLLLQTTPECIIQAALNQNGSRSPVPYAVAVLSGLDVKLSYIRTRFAPESVSEHRPASGQGGWLRDASVTNGGDSSRPSTEDWWLIRKPLSEKSVARNVLEHGTGAINVDASRVGAESEPLDWCECD